MGSCDADETSSGPEQCTPFTLQPFDPLLSQCGPCVIRALFCVIAPAMWRYHHIGLQHFKNRSVASVCSCSSYFYQVKPSLICEYKFRWDCISNLEKKKDLPQDICLSFSEAYYIIGPNYVCHVYLSLVPLRMGHSWPSVLGAPFKIHVKCDRTRHCFEHQWWRTNSRLHCTDFNVDSRPKVFFTFALAKMPKLLLYICWN